MPDRAVPVPPPYRRALEEIFQLDAEQVEDIASALSGYPDRITTPGLAERVREAHPDFDEAAAGRIVEALLSLIAQERYSSASTSEVAERVAHSEDLQLPEDGREEFARRLEHLMGAEVLRTALKAHDLITEHEHVFTSARLFTDVRPVFGDAADDDPVGSVVVAMLKIEHATEYGQRSSFFVALDHSDLRALKEVVDRGLQKIDTLVTWLKSNGVAYWEYEEEVARRAERD